MLHHPSIPVCSSPTTPIIRFPSHPTSAGRLWALESSSGGVLLVHAHGMWSSHPATRVEVGPCALVRIHAAPADSAAGTDIVAQLPCALVTMGGAPAGVERG